MCRGQITRLSVSLAKQLALGGKPDQGLFRAGLGREAILGRIRQMLLGQRCSAWHIAVGDSFLPDTPDLKESPEEA